MAEKVWWQDPSARLPLLEMAVLDLLSFTAVTSTIGLFLCGIPICQDIRRKKTSEGTNPAPFLLGSLSCFMWLRYGFLKDDSSIVTVNGIGFILQVAYLFYYYSYTRVKRLISQQIAFIAVCALGVAGYVEAYRDSLDMAVNHLGFMCMILNILNFAAPLAALREVFKSQSCESLPLPLCIANLLVSVQWFLYGVLVLDPYIKTPNAIGIVLSIIQLSLFLVYPRKRVHGI